MRTWLLAAALVLAAFSAQAQTNLYENPDFDVIARSHEIIGVLPFKTTVTLRPKDMKDITPEQLARMEASEGLAIQGALHSWFLKRDKRGALAVDVQDPNTTNALLAKADISADNYDQFTPAELAAILGVDAVVMGTFETNKPMSEGAALVVGALFGVFGNTNRAVLNLYIYNAADGALLVNYNKGVTGSIGTSTEDLINTLMRKASRRIAYTK